jgi:hypothetical protein
MKLECPVCGADFALFESLSTHLRWNHIDDRTGAPERIREERAADDH